MARSAFDFDRPMQIGRDPATKMYIGMYFDKPGVYINAFGKPVAETLAKSAGFDVAKYARQRIRQDKLSNFQRGLDAELELAQDGDESKVLASRGGYTVLRLASGMVIVMDDQSNEKVTPVPVAEQIGLDLLDQLVIEETDDGSAKA